MGARAPLNPRGLWLLLVGTWHERSWTTGATDNSLTWGPGAPQQKNRPGISEAPPFIQGQAKESSAGDQQVPSAQFIEITIFRLIAANSLEQSTQRNSMKCQPTCYLLLSLINNFLHKKIYPFLFLNNCRKSIYDQEKFTLLKFTKSSFYVIKMNTKFNKNEPVGKNLNYV